MYITFKISLNNSKTEFVLNMETPGTLPETNSLHLNSLHLKMDGWNMTCPFGIAYFK